MVEFIILGQIPGTNLYLSFTAIGVIALGAAVFSGVVTTKQLREARTKHKQEAIQQKAI